MSEYQALLQFQQSFNFNIKGAILDIRKYFCVPLFAIAALLSGCATTTQTNSSQQPAAMVEVPALKVAIDCGTCAVKSTIPSLVIEGYNAEAAKSGARIVTSKEATLTIKEYTARNDAARFLVGAFAGKDEIKADVTYQDKTFSVEDYYRNAWLGIDTLAKNIGEMAFAKLKQGRQ